MIFEIYVQSHLTGFKFIGNAALDLERAGYEVPFGYEEAIGFMFGSEIRDKDGVAATVSCKRTIGVSQLKGWEKLMFAEMATELRSQGSTIHSYLKGLYERCVYYLVPSPR